MSRQHTTISLASKRTIPGHVHLQHTTHTDLRTVHAVAGDRGRRDCEDSCEDSGDVTLSFVVERHLAPPGHD